MINIKYIVLNFIPQLLTYIAIILCIVCIQCIALGLIWLLVCLISFNWLIPPFKYIILSFIGLIIINVIVFNGLLLTLIEDILINMGNNGHI